MTVLYHIPSRLERKIVRFITILLLLRDFYGIMSPYQTEKGDPLMKMMKRLSALLVVAMLAVCLSACGSSFADDVTLLVQGNLDELYLCKFDQEYMELVNTTEEDCMDNYLGGLEMEAEVFAYYFNITNPTDEINEQIIELYKQIYSHSKFTVNPASELDENTYAVKVQVSPIDIFQRVVDAEAAGALDDFYGKYTEAQVNAMSDAEYAAYDAEWANRIIQLCYQELENVDYMEEQSLAIQVSKDSDGFWSITDNDLAAIDELIIYYP